jgi:hypothetical protein
VKALPIFADEKDRMIGLAVTELTSSQFTKPFLRDGKKAMNVISRIKTIEIMALRLLEDNICLI